MGFIVLFSYMLLKYFDSIHPPFTFFFNLFKETSFILLILCVVLWISISLIFALMCIIFFLRLLLFGLFLFFLELDVHLLLFILNLYDFLLMKALLAIKFPYLCCVLLLYLHLIPQNFFIPSTISLINYWLFKSKLFYLHVFEYFL
jgi:hypothetical protein